MTVPLAYVFQIQHFSFFSLTIISYSYLRGFKLVLFSSWNILLLALPVADSLTLSSQLPEQHLRKKFPDQFINNGNFARSSYFPSYYPFSFIHSTHCCLKGLPCFPPAMQQTQVQSLDWEDSLEKGMATHSSTLAWRIPWTEEPGGLHYFSSVQLLSRVRLCDSMVCSMPGLPVHHQLPEFTQTHAH